MKLKMYGYKTKTVEMRHMTIAELKLSIIEGYVRSGFREVQLIDITSGDSTTFRNVRDVAENAWSGNCEIELLNLPHKYGFDLDNKTVVIFQEANDWDEYKVIE